MPHIGGNVLPCSLPGVIGSESAALGGLLARRAEGPGAERLAFAQGGERWSFAELFERALSRAGAFEALGLRSGDRVALTMSAGLRFVEVFWALQLIGAVPCAFSPGGKPEALERRIARTRPRLIVSDGLVDEMCVAGPPRRETEIDPDSPAVLQLTSGTSGEPRAAIITHRNVHAFLRATSHHIAADDVLVSWVPPWHDLGLMRFVIGTVHHACACHIVEPSILTIPDWLRTVSRVGGTVTAGPDFCYRLATRMVDSGSVDLSSLTFATIAAEPVRPATIEAFERHFAVPGALLPAYGLAEATVGVTSHLPGDRIVVDERGNVSCGPILPGVEVRTGASLLAPEEIRIRGDVVFAGYFDAPDDTRAALRDGWLHTGDVGYRDPDGQLFVLGRRSGMLKRAGAVIAPRELEDAALRVPGVRAAAALGIPMDGVSAGGLRDETITIVVEARATAERTVEDIAAEVSREVTAWSGFAPGRVAVVAPRAIPRTTNGKMRHDQLRAALTGGATV
jgi:acyl-CoA synthetase (AMP-forming)/AMP-acid ligase II